MAGEKGLTKPKVYQARSCTCFAAEVMNLALLYQQLSYKGRPHIHGKFEGIPHPSSSTALIEPHVHLNNILDITAPLCHVTIEQHREEGA